MFTQALVLLLTAISSPTQSDHSADRDVLTRGVTALVAPQALVGVLSVSGNAFVIATGTQSKGQVPVFAATRVERGRVIAGAHEAFFSSLAMQNPSNGRFFGNALAWVGGKGGLDGLRVGLLGYGFLEGPLRQAGAVPTTLSSQSLETIADQLDVVCTTPGALDNNPSGQIALMRFVKKGRGLVIAGPAWGWLQLNPRLDLLADHPGNRMLFPYGICFADGTAHQEFLPERSGAVLFNADAALGALKGGGLSVADRTTAVYTLERALALTPPTSGGLTAEVIKGAASEPGNGIPTAQTPVTVETPFSRLKAWIDMRTMRTLTPKEVKAHPSASAFPGVVTNSKRINQAVTIDTSVPEWHGTGLYAAPGEVVLVEIPEGATSGGLFVRVGPHTDTLWQLDKWTRFPSISITKPLSQEQTQIASAFGGTIYIDVPNGCRLDKVQVTINHAVPAARYVRGKTSAAQWKSQLGTSAAPWAELEGNLVSISVPLSSAKKIVDPAALMAFWDEMMKNCYAFYAAPVRPRPERYCPDIEISAGYMHSGYPVMTHLDVADTFCDLATLKAKGHTWGFYHEMGHNFQQNAWTWEGTGEVTNNFFSLYGSEKLNGVTPANYGEAHPAMAPKAVRERLVKYLADGAHYDKWRSDPFLALSMYAQLREQFGWEPFTRLFEEYRTLRPSEQPKSDIEKRDRWMVRFSKLVRKNLGPFFTAWGVPTTEAAKKSIANLPTWMPTDWPK